MRDWYERYYAAILHSQTYAKFCCRVFGSNLGQHGFADQSQVAMLSHELDIGPDDRVLEVGCGHGGILAGIAAKTGACAVGVDYVERAVAAAQEQYASDRVDFVAADMAALCFSRCSFDVVISIDTLYFTPIRATVAALAELLRSGGQMGILYSHGASPECPLDEFDVSTLPPEHTPLGIALRDEGLRYTATDLTESDRRHATCKQSVLEDLQTEFVTEDNEFLFQNRYGEAMGVLAAINAGAHARYLYVVK